MAATKASLEQAKGCIAPLPSATRGWGIHVDSTKKDDKLVYAAGTQVVIRSLEDPSQSWLFDGHRCKVNVAKFSPNGEWVASGDDKGRVFVWGTKNQIVKGEYNIVSHAILDIAWDADGKRLIACGKGNQAHAKVFSWDTGSNLGSISGHSKPILSCDYRRVRPYRAVTSSEDFLCCFHEGPPFKFSHSFSGHSNYPSCVRYSPDGAFLATVGSDKKIHILDGKEGTLVKAFEAKESHTGGIYSVSWSPDSKSIATSSADKTVKLWNVEDGSVTKTFTLGKDVLDFQVAVQWHSTGKYLVSVSLSGQINYLNVETGEVSSSVHGHQDNITSLVVDRVNKLIYSSDNQGIVCFDTTTLKGTRFAGKGHQKGVVAVAVSGDGTTVTSVGLDDKLRVSDAKSQEFGADAAAIGGSPTGLAAGNKDAGLAVAIVAQGKVVVTRGGKVTHSEAVSYRPESVAISVDDTTVAVGGGDNKIHLYTIEGDTLKAGQELEGPSGKVLCVNYSADGRFLAVTGTGREIYVYEVGSYKMLNDRGWKFHASKVGAVAVSPDGTKVASGSQDQNIFVWTDTNTFDNHRKEFIAAHTEDIIALAFLDDNTLVSAGGDRAIRLWDVSA